MISDGAKKRRSRSSSPLIGGGDSQTGTWGSLWGSVRLSLILVYLGRRILSPQYKDICTYVSALRIHTYMPHECILERRRCEFVVDASWGDGYR